MTTAAASYWTSTGEYQDLADKLSTLVPASGLVVGSPKLEKYRKVCNAYYHLFNDGRCGNISGLLGVSGRAVLDGDAEAVQALEKPSQK